MTTRRSMSRKVSAAIFQMFSLLFSGFTISDESTGYIINYARATAGVYGDPFERPRNPAKGSPFSTRDKNFHK